MDEPSYCEERAQLYGISCQPPWHFCGWYEIDSAQMLYRAAKLLNIPLRLGENICPSRTETSDGVDIWMINHEDIGSLWQHVYQDTNGIWTFSLV